MLDNPNSLESLLFDSKDEKRVQERATQIEGFILKNRPSPHRTATEKEEFDNYFNSVRPVDSGLSEEAISERLGWLNAATKTSLQSVLVRNISMSGIEGNMGRWDIWEDYAPGDMDLLLDVLAPLVVRRYYDDITTVDSATYSELLNASEVVLIGEKNNNKREGGILGTADRRKSLWGFMRRFRDLDLPMSLDMDRKMPFGVGIDAMLGIIAKFPELMDHVIKECYADNKKTTEPSTIAAFLLLYYYYNKDAYTESGQADSLSFPAITMKVIGPNAKTWSSISYDLMNFLTQMDQENVVADETIVIPEPRYWYARKRLKTGNRLSEEQKRLVREAIISKSQRVRAAFKDWKRSTLTDFIQAGVGRK